MQNDSPTEDAPPPAPAPEPQPIYAYVVEMPTQTGAMAPVVPCMVMDGPQGQPQSIPLIAFSEQQKDALMPQAQHVANSISKPLRIFQGSFTEVGRLEPKLVMAATEAPRMIR